MLFCTTTAPGTGRPDISFPNQVDVKVNGSEVRASFRGLKNKAGTTRPVDITEIVSRNQRPQSEMTVSYALTNKVSLSGRYRPDGVNV